MTTYDVYLGLIGKRVVDFLLVLIELFRYTEALLAKIIENRPVAKMLVSIRQIFTQKVTSPTNYFCSVVMPMHALQLCR